MNTTVRNIDDDVYRLLKAHAALTRRTVGDILTEAVRAYLAGTGGTPRRGSLAELRPEDYPKGNERLSEEVDAVVYGSRRR
jgi:plasmid stability protein